MGLEMCGGYAHDATAGDIFVPCAKRGNRDGIKKTPALPMILKALKEPRFGVDG